MDVVGVISGGIGVIVGGGGGVGVVVGGSIGVVGSGGVGVVVGSIVGVVGGGGVVVVVEREQRVCRRSVAWLVISSLLACVAPLKVLSLLTPPGSYTMLQLLLF